MIQSIPIAIARMLNLGEHKMTFSEALEEYLEAREAIKEYDDGPNWDSARRQRLVGRKRVAAEAMDSLAPSPSNPPTLFGKNG